MDSEQKPYEENDSLGESGYKSEERAEEPAPKAEK